MSNVVNYLKAAAEKNPLQTAIAFPGKSGDISISFANLWEKIDHFSTALIKRGLKPGDRVIIMIPMSIELYISLLGVIKMGGVAVFADPWVPVSQIIQFCKFAEPKGFIGIGKSHLLRWRDTFLRRLPLTVTTGCKYAGMLAKYSFQEMLAGNESSEIFVAADDNSALITFTTGSSGIPKGANRTHGFLDAQKKALDQEFPILDADVDMPMFPVFALRNLANGITSIIPDMDFKNVAAVDGEKLFRQLKQYQVNTITASPPFFDKLAESMAKQQPFGFRRLLTGGAPVKDSQLEKWQEIFADTKVEIVYGSTEAEPVAHISLPERLRTDSCKGFCAGKPTELIQTKIIKIIKGKIDAYESLDDFTLPVGEVGELLVAGKHVCRDYFNNSEAVKENKLMDENGVLWHRMGDTGFFDQEGRFWLVGRVHSTICRQGKFYHPQIIEEITRREHPDIKQVAALGIADEKLGEKIIVVIKFDQGNEVFIKVVKEKLNELQIPVDRVLVLNESFPVDPRHNSKIDYQRLRERIL